MEGANRIYANGTVLHIPNTLGDKEKDVALERAVSGVKWDLKYTTPILVEKLNYTALEINKLIEDPQKNFEGLINLQGNIKQSLVANKLSNLEVRALNSLDSNISKLASIANTEGEKSKELIEA